MNEYLLNPNVCPSSLGEDDKPVDPSNTAHKYFDGACAECGRIVDNDEITNEIYDTLLGNDMHPQIDLNQVSSQELEAHRGRISFNYKGRSVNISISSDPI